MHEYLIDRQTLGLREVQRLAGVDGRFRYADAVGARLLADRQVVEQRLEAGAPVYGLNTGLGGNIGYRLTPQETVAWQRQIIAGRMIGMGDPLPDEVARFAYRQGLFVLAQSGDAILVRNDDRFTPKEW